MAVKHAPKHAGHVTALCGAMATTAAADEIAEQACQEAVRLAPKSTEAWFALGSMHAARQEYEEAASTFEAGLRHQPGHVRSNQELSVVHYQMGQNAKAIKVTMTSPELRGVFSLCFLYCFFYSWWDHGWVYRPSRFVAGSQRGSAACPDRCGLAGQLSFLS